DGTLKKRMRTKEMRFYHVLRKPKFRRDFLRRDVEALSSFYNRNGFFEAKVSVESIEKDERANTVRIRLMVNEGPQTLVRSVEFSGQDLIREKSLRMSLRLVEGEPYNPNLLEADRYTLFGIFFEKGYLEAKVAYSVKLDSTEVNISWMITPREPVHVGSVELEGNRKVKEGLIRRELTFEKGEFFNLKKVLESKQNLYDTGYFTSVEIEPKELDREAEEVDLLMQVRERKMGYIETGLGVGNVHGNRVFAEWGQRNLLGRGYALNMKTAYAFRLFPDNEYSLSKMDFRSKYMRHNGELRFPHILSTWNTFSLGAFYERDATIEPAIVKALSFSASVSRRFSRRTSLLFGYSFERIRRLEVVEEKEKSRRRSLDFIFTRDTRDYYFNPKRGRYATVEGRFAGGSLGGEDHFYSLVVSFQSYGNLSRNTVFAYRIRAGYADAFGDSREAGLPIESRFFAGGGNSVRGYRENSLGPLRDGNEARGGRVLLLTNLELRFPIPYLSKYNFGGAIFFDGGNVWNSIEEIKGSYFRLVSRMDDTTILDYRYGTGLGIRYYTPVGPIRLDIGFPVKKTPDMDYNNWIHISLGQIF
ncbi:MAG: outer membrane protein assembly factor BamA, partial [Candidatus Krumholzibacteria bacterium]|nr:outer membrane protein assembly factor BamA [Candidatus Krumholzibacteria bacterium]